MVKLVVLVVVGERKQAWIARTFQEFQEVCFGYCDEAGSIM